jgi:hypothetical protein
MMDCGEPTALSAMVTAAEEIYNQATVGSGPGDPTAMIGLEKGRLRARARLLGSAICMAFGIAGCNRAASAQALSPAALRVDELVTPLGIDDAQPRFSWQLQDRRTGAKQNAFQLLVATKPELLAVGKADV